MSLNLPRRAGLLLPSLFVHAFHEQPKGQRAFSQKCGRYNERSQAGSERRRQKGREGTDDGARSANGQQSTKYPRQEGRPNNQTSDQEALKSEKRHANVEALYV